MNMLTTSTRPAMDRIPSDLEGLLLWLQAFGKPRVGIYGERGWACTVEMHVRSVGASFDIKSDHTNPTPLAACQQCAERLGQTLRDMGVA